MRLWLSGHLNGKRKRLLLAYSREAFNLKLRATELQLPRTEMCQNTSLEFQIKVLPGIHFYQSDVPYEQIDQSNIWTKWTPTSELLASTPGREKINPPAPSPRNQQNSTVDQTIQPQQKIKQKMCCPSPAQLELGQANVTKQEDHYDEAESIERKTTNAFFNFF